MNTPQSDTYEERSIKNTKNIFFWSITWGVTFVAASASVKLWWPENSIVLIGAVATHISLMICAINAHWKWLKSLDDLQRQMHLYSMAFTLGATWLVTTLLILLKVEQFSFGRWHLEIIVIVMALSWALGNVIGMRRSA